MTEYPDVRPYQQLCDIDGIPIDEHPKCRGCGILIGPGHLEPTAYEGYCGYCFMAIRKQQEKRRMVS